MKTEKKLHLKSIQRTVEVLKKKSKKKDGAKVKVVS